VDSGGGEPADHFPKRGVLAADLLQIGHAQIFQPRYTHWRILVVMTQRRTVFFVSDGTGITAQMLGHSLLTQFEGVEFNQVTFPFVDSTEKAEECLARISAESDSGQPIVFSTLVNNDVRAVVRKANALFIDFFESFIDPLEAGLGIKSSHTIGRSHSAMDKKEYQQRIEAINFAMAHDDGASHRELGLADVILIGVSRSGKTPTSLYLAMQFGVKAANYPLIPEDFHRGKLPEALRGEKSRLYGLTIASERLHEIRKERRPGSRYAELDNCRFEVQEAENLMRREGIRSINSTSKSIEEIATTILRELRIQRQVY
jgi:regulator of PEP synthase PpsR (kinase-PPPase family)